MNRLHRGTWVGLSLLLAGGCSQGLLGELDRVLRDPSVSAPRVSSLERECRVEVSWEADPGAEEYVLERAEDTAVGAYSEVYRGTRTSYTDSECEDQCRYLYRLSKTRGTRLFGPSDPVLGVASAVCRDELEPNDLEEQATALEYDRRANLFYYRATPSLDFRAELQDVDWYAVDVPPRRVANLLVTQLGLAQGSQYTFMYFYLKGTTPIHVVNNDLIGIANSSYNSRRFLFKLYPDPDEFLPSASLGGGLIIDYTLSLYSIVSL